MKFSLKTMLISICAVGAILGVMGRLLTENPEQFLRVMNVFSTIVPFVLAGGTIIWIGLRSKKFQLATICAQCKHDLSKVDLQAVQTVPAVVLT